MAATVWTEELRVKLRELCEEERRVNRRDLSCEKAARLLGVSKSVVWYEFERWKAAQGKGNRPRKSCRTLSCRRPVVDEEHTDWRYCFDCRRVMSDRARYSAGDMAADVRD